MKKPAASKPLCLVLSFALLLIAMVSGYSAPANDSFSAPVVITGFPASQAGTNIDATIEGGEFPYFSAAESSVWFEWTAASTGFVQIDTLGSDFDTMLSVWTGSTLGALNEVASNDEYDGGNQSGVFLSAVSGTTYRIAVYGYRSEQGSILLNITPALAGSIAGHLANNDGTVPLAGITVTAYRIVTDPYFSYMFQTDVTTDELGNYSLDVPPGTYRLEFNDSASGEYATEFFDDSETLFTAQDIAVEHESAITGIDAQLADASHISGTVTGPDGNSPLEDIDVLIFKSNPAEESWSFAGNGFTDALGHFRIGGLSAGTYRVEFRDNINSNYAPETYDDAANFYYGLDVIIPEATEIMGINASLALAGKIYGNVKNMGNLPLEGITVQAYRWIAAESYWEYASANQTDSLGNYRIGGLKAGTYRIGFTDYEEGAYSPEYYDDVAELNDGQDIIITEGGEVFDIDAILGAAGKITGAVTDVSDSSPIYGIYVAAYGWNSSDSYWEYKGYDHTNSQGEYAIAGLREGLYRVEFVDNNGAYIRAAFDNASDIYSGADVEVSLGATVTGIDAALAKAGRISGVVTGPDGVSPLGNVSVSAYRWDENSSSWVYATGITTYPSDGSYQIGELVEGTYRLEFYEYETGLYLTEYYNNVPDFESAEDIEVLAGFLLTGYNASLSLSAPPLPPEIIAIIPMGGNSFELQFTGQPGMSYQLQKSLTLSGFEDLGDPFVCQPGINILPVEQEGSKTFWLVKTAP